MSMTINEIIKLSLERLRKKHLSLTPDNYSKIFCEVAKEKKIVVEDCQKIEKSLKKLDQNLQNDAKRYKITDVDELLSFYVALINRSNIAENQKTMKSFLLLAKRLLQAVTMLHNKKATDLANTSIRLLEGNPNPKTIEGVRDRWLEFISNYDESFLDDLGQYGINKVDDFASVVKSVKEVLSNSNAKAPYEFIAPLIIASLTPSIASSMNDDLANISDSIKKNPEILSNKNTHEEIKSFIKKRIELDKKEVSSKMASLNTLLDEINEKIISLIDTSESHSKEVGNIKVDLQAINLKKDGFDSIYSRLLSIANSLESETKSLTKHIQKDKNTIDNLKIKVNRLEVALVEAKKESKEDFLTHVATKRALTNELERAEEAFKRYNINYCLCFFDIDYFKVVNDTYGHEAGDVILATIGKILNKYIRRVDFVGRYGGEEFLVILPNINQTQAIIFADKVRKIIENFKFIYKKERINISISGGVSERSRVQSMDETLQTADKNLYKSKENGRNRIYPTD